MRLVFGGGLPTLAMMDKLLFRRLFDRSQTPARETAETQADRGDADAQFHLGLKCANGEGEAKDYAQAAQWYSKAADQNHPLAQFNLGIMYAKGQGVHQSEAEAGIWFGKAAQQGDAGAQHSLGMGHYRASLQGLPRDLPESRIEACKWFILAAAQGYRDSDAARATVALNMTQEDITEATRRVVTFMPSIGGTPASQ
jgi:hypothetical protein